MASQLTEHQEQNAKWKEHCLKNKSKTCYIFTGLLTKDDSTELKNFQKLIYWNRKNYIYLITEIKIQVP